MCECTAECDCTRERHINSLLSEFAFPDGVVVRRNNPSKVLWTPDEGYTPTRKLGLIAIYPGVGCDCDDCIALMRYVEHYQKHGTTWPTVR